MSTDPKDNTKGSTTGSAQDKAALPTGAAERKTMPLARGLLDYFPAALAEVAHVSWVGNEQHNPGQPLHHARGKSSDHADCLVRHLVDRGQLDSDGLRHTAKAAWRALALLQEELEAAGAALPRGAKPAESVAEPIATTSVPWDVPCAAEHPKEGWTCRFPRGHVGGHGWWFDTQSPAHIWYAETASEHFARCDPFCQAVKICVACSDLHGICPAHQGRLVDMVQFTGRPCVKETAK